MADFEPIFKFLIRPDIEGEYSNTPHDAGGETKYGISKRSFPNVDIKSLTVERAKELYKEHYWNPLHGSKLPQPLALTLFDFAVNSGLDFPVRELQKFLGVVVDGKFGPKTLRAVQALDEKEVRALTNQINDARLRNFLRLANKPTQKRFLLGWLRRLMEVIKEL